jgi:hypothetical protein
VNVYILDTDGDTDGMSNLANGDDCGSTSDLFNSLVDVGRIYQMVSNSDGSLSLVALDSSHLTSLLQGSTNGEQLCLLLKCGTR